MCAELHVSKLILKIHSICKFNLGVIPSLTYWFRERATTKMVKTKEITILLLVNKGTAILVKCTF